MNKKKYLYLCASAALIFLVSCGPPNEKAHPAFQNGVKYKKNEEYRKAAGSFEKYLIFNYTNPQTHYELAELYNDYLDDPFFTVYHFRQFLKYKPDSPERDTIQAWIESAEEKLVERIRQRNPDFTSEEEVQRLKEYNEKYRIFLVKLKNKNAALRKKLNSVVVISSKKYTSGKDTESGETDKMRSEFPDHFVITRTYKIKSGDSLSKISREVYGSSKYYKLIFDANSDILESESKLDVGQELRIPQLQKEKDNLPAGNKSSTGDDVPDVITE